MMIRVKLAEKGKFRRGAERACEVAVAAQTKRDRACGKREWMDGWSNVGSELTWESLRMLNQTLFEAKFLLFFQTC